MDRDERVQRVRRLLDILTKCENEQFQSFCDALITDEQGDIVDKYLRREDVAKQRQQQQPGELCRIEGNL